MLVGSVTGIQTKVIGLQMQTTQPLYYSNFLTPTVLKSGVGWGGISFKKPQNQIAMTQSNSNKTHTPFLNFLLENENLKSKGKMLYIFSYSYEANPNLKSFICYKFTLCNSYLNFF